VKTPTKTFMLTVLLATVAISAFAQTQSSRNATITPPAAIVSVTSPDATIPPSETAAPPMMQGAGSDNAGYIVFRGYLFHIKRTNGDPAVINGSAAAAVTSVDNFKYGKEAAFKVEAGWNGTNNWGVRGAFFYTSQSANENRTGATTAPFFVSPRPLNVTFTGPAANGTAATYREKFRLPVFDFEGSYKWHSPNSTALASFGIRFAPSKQTYTASDIFVATPENLIYVQKRTGIGPTAAIDWRHRINAHWWWTGTGRVAILFGKIKETATYTSGAFTQTATRNLGRTNFVLEGETGVEWMHKYPSGNEIFVNGSFVAHDWNNLLNVMPVSAVGGGATALLDAPTAAPTKKGSVIMIGGSFALGFRF
jgi:hypothetical protein